jgi:hypothetical protein
VFDAVSVLHSPGTGLCVCLLHSRRVIALFDEGLFSIHWSCRLRERRAVRKKRCGCGESVVLY